MRTKSLYDINVVDIIDENDNIGFYNLIISFLDATLVSRWVNQNCLDTLLFNIGLQCCILESSLHIFREHVSHDIVYDGGLTDTLISNKKYSDLLTIFLFILGWLRLLFLVILMVIFVVFLPIFKGLVQIIGILGLLLLFNHLLLLLL